MIIIIFLLSLFIVIIHYWCYYSWLLLLFIVFIFITICQEIKALQTEIEQLGEQGEVEKAEEANKKVCPNPKA